MCTDSILSSFTHFQLLRYLAYVWNPCKLISWPGVSVLKVVGRVDVPCRRPRKSGAVLEGVDKDVNIMEHLSRARQLIRMLLASPPRTGATPSLCKHLPYCGTSRKTSYLSRADNVG